MKDPSRGFPPSSRRSFLKTGAGAAAGLWTASSASGIVPARDVPGERPVQPPSPSWVRDLIIYEIATKGFTSPRGPETGTFNSLQAKLPYLQELGITGIWLTGHSLADSHFFYNIWTQYANIEPGKIDPSLGTPGEFKTLIAEAHQHGIRVFLDVHVHGILSFSPLIKEHPDWFRGGSWHMTDYDWAGGHTDLDDWWVKIWTNYVTEYGVDGFRLDYRIFRPDLWERIRQNAAAGHEIVIFEEDDAVIPGVTDFTQHDHAMRIPPPSSPHPRLNPHLLSDVPGFYDRLFGKKGYYRVEIQYADDGSRASGDTDGQGPLRVRLAGLTADKLCRRINDVHADGIADIQLTIENIASRPIENILVTDDMGGSWQLQWGKNNRLLTVDGTPPTIQVYVATLAHGWPCIMLSCHDEGWEGFPADQSPYVAQGSRALFGYSCLFTPMIPIFFAGEEFDATFRPIPWLSPHLWGGGELGAGKWLYGTMLDWNELQHPEHADMFADVKGMLSVRRQVAALLGLPAADQAPQLMAVPHQSDFPVPVPYLRWNQHAAILVAANRDAGRDAHLVMQVPVKELGWAGRGRFNVSALWPAGESKTCTEKDLENFSCTVPRDKARQGGLRVFKIEV
jgi:glycosidase